MNATAVAPAVAQVLELEDQPARPVMVQQHAVSAPANASHLTAVDYAMQRGATVAEVQALVQMQIQMDNHRLAMRKQDDEREREMRAEAAKTAYFEAMAKFKAEHVRVVRNKMITDGPLKGKKHADLFAVTDAATEALSKHGLSASFKPVEDTKDWIKIACIVKHTAGYSESVEFGGPIDTGPGRNAIQARKSTVTYLERITLLLALGLSESDADDDGGHGFGSMLADWTAKAEECATTADLNRTAKEGAAAFTKAKDVPGYAAFGKAVAARRAALGGAHA